MFATLVEAEPRPHVIELFTSQGCSSCPPADALLGELARRPDVLALAFHVDYWDSLGWRDRFASPLFTQRQQQYTEALRLPDMFTPQAVIDGERSVVGSNRNALLAMLKAPGSGIPIRVRIEGSEAVIDIDAHADTAVCDVVLIRYLPQAATHIPHGENAGRTLNEFNIVREYRVLGVWNGSMRQYRAPLSTVHGAQIAVLVQQRGQGAIIGATSMAVP